MTTYTFSDNADIQELIKHDRHVHLISGISSLAGWDQEVFMPPKGAENRAKQLGMLAELIHSESIKPIVGDLLKKLEDATVSKPEDFTVTDKAYIRDMRRDYDQNMKLPAAFVRTMSEHESRSLEAWKQARTDVDFSKFSGHLATFIDLLKEQAEYLGYKETAYDALLDLYEPGNTHAQTQAQFAPLKGFTVELLQKIQNADIQIDDAIVRREYDVQLQEQFCNQVAVGIGYDADSGRLDPSTHPFSTQFGTKYDTRITTRYERQDIMMAVGSTIHETGHALYEQGISDTIDGTSLGGGVSLGIHESQSRMWENMVAKSPEFWQHWFPKLTALFPSTLQASEQQQFVHAMNKVAASPIRIEADELTYNLHVILRFELEAALMSGDVQVQDLPEAWNAKMREYLGVTPNNDAEGVLQDIHWSMGAFGYFCTYSLGNMYAAQLWATIQTALPNLMGQIATGDCSELLTWLRTNIHEPGCIYRPAELIKNVTNEPLNGKYLQQYLSTKFSDIYALDAL